MAYISSDGFQILNQLLDSCNSSDPARVSSLANYLTPLDISDEYHPSVWIGVYIALASVCCILAMVADLVHGLRSRKLWFPCKYFSANAFFLAVISVAMKLLVEPAGDQAAKIGSMAFMCTMMANLLPCLATMDNNELLTNITALVVQVIGLVVNVCIQIQTQVVWNSTIATIYVTLLLVLLMIHVCSSLAILKSKQIIELKYQQGHETASKDIQESILTVEKLQNHVSNHWIMARSGSPEFIIACSPTTAASGVICALVSILNTITMSWSVSDFLANDYDSDYGGSTPLILILQFVGVILGTIAPLSRCFASLSFKVSIKSIANHMNVIKVEKYWTHKLYDWKYDSISFPCRSRKLKVVIMILKRLILNFSIKFQVGVVAVCKIIAMIPFLFMLCIFYCLRCLKKGTSSSTEKRMENLEESPYVLQLENETKLYYKTLEGLSKSLNQSIQKSENKQPKNLMSLITEKSTIGFQGVRKFVSNNHDVQCSLSKGEYRDCWSLLVVTLTTIAVTLPNIEKVEIKSLLKSVKQGLKYVTFVEENLNASDDYVRIRKAAESLWEEVSFRHKWLGTKLSVITSRVNATDCEEDPTTQIIQLFLEEAEKKSKEGVGSTDIGVPDGYCKCISICAYSMCCITKTIINDKESHTKLFEELSSWIADIVVACLTNLPQAIAMKCHTSVIEKREEYVLTAAQILGETKEIIETLQDPRQEKWHAYLTMSLDNLPFIDKWRAYLSGP